jgi:protein O-mannosyl-transferase
VTSPESNIGSRRWYWMASVVIAAGTFLVYARVASYPFIYFDDNRYVTENPVVLRGLTSDGLRWAFTTLQVSNWHPLTWLSHMTDVELFGPAPGPAHLVNVAIHALNAVLLLLALGVMTGAPGRSAFVATLFALHPTHVESVAWVAERKDVLSTFFGLLALLAYAAWCRRAQPRQYVAFTLAFVASLLAKPMWVTLPFLLLLLDVWPLQRLAGSPVPVESLSVRFPPRPLRWLLIEKVPLLLLSAASAAVTVLAQARGGALQGLELGLAERLGNAAVAYVRYGWKTIWPASLAVYYPHASGGEASWAIAGATAVLIVASAFAVSQLRRMPWIAVGWFWFLGTLVPVIGLVQVGAQAMADRYTYLPTVGLCVAGTWTVWAVASAWKAEMAARVMGLACIVGLGWMTFVQAGYWSSHETLFRHSLELEPGSSVAHGALSEGLRRAGRTDEALAEAREAVRIAPTTARHWNNLGVSLRDARRLREALSAFRESVRLEPDYVPGWVNAGQTELDLGNSAEALKAYETALVLGTDAPSAWSNAGMLLLGASRVSEAGRAFTRVTELQPASPVAWRNLGVYFVQVGRSADAERAFLEALRFDPGNADVVRRLASVRSGAGH